MEDGGLGSVIAGGGGATGPGEGGGGGGVHHHRWGGSAGGCIGGMASGVRAAWLARLSKSATDWLTIEQHESMEACASKLRADGYETLVATTPLTEGAEPLYGGAPADGKEWARQRVAILFGSEGSGLSPAALRLADVRVSVPQLGMTQSLNVAACAAIVLGEALRRRSAPLSSASIAAEPPMRLSEEEQQALEAKLMPNPGAKPPRLHNKARAKYAMRELFR